VACALDKMAWPAIASGSAVRPASEGVRVDVGARMRGKTTYSARAENTHGFGQLSKNDFMLSHSTASVWSDEAGGGHDRDRLPVQSRLALGAQRQWRRQSRPW
jgi:hypothetical protein